MRKNDALVTKLILLSMQVNSHRTGEKYKLKTGQRTAFR